MKPCFRLPGGSNCGVPEVMAGMPLFFVVGLARATFNLSSDYPQATASAPQPLLDRGAREHIAFTYSD
jgi:hypothetical protein